jgi:hypothetical protein
MIIVLDTNVLQEDFPLRSGRVRVLLDYAERTQARFALPRIVFEEVRTNYERELKKRASALIRAREQLNGIRHTQDTSRLDIDYAAESAAYMARLLHVLGLKEQDVVPYRPEYLSDVLTRAMQRRRPCTERGEEIRDAVLWHMILDIAESANQQVIFISRNTDQFTGDKVHLHPDMVEEVAARGVQVQYLPSLEEFARQHATKIALITKDWLEQQIDAYQVLDLAYDQIMEAAREKAYRQRSLHEEIDGSFSMAGGGVEVDEYFVNLLADEDLRVEMAWWGTVDVSYEVSSREDLLGVDFGFGSHTVRSKEVELSVQVIVQALVEGGRITEWSKVDSWAE